MCDLTMLAFELADRYRNPAAVITDGFTGQMMEAVELPAPLTELPDKPWAVKGTPETDRNLINSIYLTPEELESIVTRNFEKYAVIEEREVRFEEVHTEDAELVVVGYGIVSRLLRSAVVRARAEGLRVGLLRPITLWPFPKNRIAELSGRVKGFLVSELSTGQMVEDVRLAIEGRCPVHFHGRWGGAVPSVEELKRAIQSAYPAEGRAS